MSILIQNGMLVTMNPSREVFTGDLLVDGKKIQKIGKNLSAHVPKSTQVIDATNKFVVPGLVQAHVHLCQILFRGEADDLALLDWLEKKIWPMEHAHSEDSIRASARLGLLEMQKYGTTTILDMGTVQHADALLETVIESGMRYWGGKCLMDAKDLSGPLYEETSISLRETERLISAWKNRSELVNYALCPRFVVSCTQPLLEACASLQKQHDCLVHTHASENLDEIALVQKLTGLGNIEYLNKIDLLNSKSVIVHGVHMSDQDVALMAKQNAPLVHCPTSNLKLASGIAPIDLYLKKGLTIGLGCDGAPCNNTMDPFIEMKLCALLQKPRFGPTALPAKIAFELATLGGAKVLNQASCIGSLEAGKLADIVLVDRTHPSVCTVDDPYSALVYSCTGRDVTDVFINGRQIISNRAHVFWNEEEIAQSAQAEKKKLLERL